MKIAVITDTHFGCRKNSLFYMTKQKEFFENDFFPYLIKNGIKKIFHLGDFFDNRKTVNFDTLRHAKDVFINPIIKNGMELHMIVGNHDSYYKSNGDLTSTKLLFDDIREIFVYDNMSECIFDDKRVLFVPWLFPIQKGEFEDRIRVSNYDVVCGHFEMNGVVYQGNTVSRKGLDTDIFSHFPHVFSGHFHKKSKFYVGTPYQMSWSDYGDSKRIIVYDTDTDKYESVYLSEDIYEVIEYPLEQHIVNDDRYKDKILKIIVKTKDDPGAFDKFIEYLETLEPYEIIIKDEYLYIDIIDHDEIDEDADTLSILLQSIDEIGDLEKGDCIVIKDIMKKLYEKASE